MKEYPLTSKIDLSYEEIIVVNGGSGRTQYISLDSHSGEFLLDSFGDIFCYGCRQICSLACDCLLFGGIIFGCVFGSIFGLTLLVDAITKDIEKQRGDSKNGTVTNNTISNSTAEDNL